MSQMTRMIKAVLIWKVLAKIWAKHLEIVTRKQRGIYISLVLKQRFFRYIKCRGLKIDGRIGVVARNSFTFLANKFYDLKYEKSLPMVSKFIEKWGIKDEFERKTVNLFTQIRCIF